MKEKVKQTIEKIKSMLPDYMVPGFNRLVSENNEKSWFEEFIDLYSSYLKDASKECVSPIAPVQALGEYLHKFDSMPECCCESGTCEPEEALEEPVIENDEEMNVAVQDETFTEEVTEDDLVETEEVPEAEEPVDII